VLDGGVVLSASDLTGFAACEHLTQLELAAARGEIERPTRDDPLLDVLSRRGTEHETQQLDAYPTDPALRVAEVTVAENSRDGLDAAEAETLKYMLDGVADPSRFKDGLARAVDAVDRLLKLVASRLGLDHSQVLGGVYAFPVMAKYLDSKSGKLTL